MMIKLLFCSPLKIDLSFKMKVWLQINLEGKGGGGFFFLPFFLQHIHCEVGEIAIHGLTLLLPMR